MTISDERENQAGRTRAGGDVETKGASQAPGGYGAGSTRAGGDVETKGASQAPNDESSTEES